MTHPIVIVVAEVLKTQAEQKKNDRWMNWTLRIATRNGNNDRAFADDETEPIDRHSRALINQVNVDRSGGRGRNAILRRWTLDR